MDEEAVHYNKNGLQLFHAQKLDEAIEFFTKAIQIDPSYPDPYQNRGEILLLMGRLVEGNADLHRAKALRSGLMKRRSRAAGPVSKYDLREIENVYDTAFGGDLGEDNNDTVAFDSDFYDSIFSDDTIETEKLREGLADELLDADGTPAVIEFLGGGREEATRLVLFAPSPNEITVIDENRGRRIIPLHEISCLRLAKLPDGCALPSTSSCQIEIIETRDGNIYHEFIPEEQHLENGLLGLSTKENTRLRFTYFPVESIKLRRQERYLGEILIEKRFIADDVLKKAIEEHQMMRDMQLGRILARQANILYSTIESAIQKAQNDGKKGLKTGEILLDAGLVNEDQVLNALEFQDKMKNKKLGEFLIEKGILNERELYISLAEKFRIPFIELRQCKVSRKILSLLPREIVLKHTVMPIGIQDSFLLVATTDPDVSSIREEIVRHSPVKNIRFVLAQPTHLKNVVNMLFQEKKSWNPGSK
jgi:tetratricopeptide (TPR) repeat protein